MRNSQATSGQSWCQKWFKSRRFLLADYMFNYGTFALLSTLWACGVLPSSYYISYGLGAVIGATWEYSNALIPGHIRLVDPDIEADHSRLAYATAHSLSDGFIFLLLFVGYRTLGPAWWGAGSLPYVGPWFFFNVYGLLLEILVEHKGNGVVWHYGENNWWNPVVCRRRHPSARLLAETGEEIIGYTVLPYATWCPWAGSLFVGVFPLLMQGFHVHY